MDPVLARILRAWIGCAIRKLRRSSGLQDRLLLTRDSTSTSRNRQARDRIRRMEAGLKLEISDADIAARLASLEDNFVERKAEGDSGDWLKTVIAFSNSTPVGYPAILFIGVKNDGTVQGLANPDSTQRSLSAKISNSFPVPYYWTKVMDSGGRKYLAVVVPGSEARPHFAGPSYVRVGSQSVPASDEQFARLLVERNSVAYELLKWKSKEVSVWHPIAGGGYHPSRGHESTAVLVDCSTFYVTLAAALEKPSSFASYSYSAIDIGFDHLNNRLQIRFKTAF